MIRGKLLHSDQIRLHLFIASLPPRAPGGDAKPDLAPCPLPSASTEGLSPAQSKLPGRIAQSKPMTGCYSTLRCYQPPLTRRADSL